MDRLAANVSWGTPKRKFVLDSMIKSFLCHFCIFDAKWQYFRQRQPATHLYSVKNILAVHILARAANENVWLSANPLERMILDGSDPGVITLLRLAELVRGSLSQLEFPL
jgi:hypothetical protein